MEQSELTELIRRVMSLPDGAPADAADSEALHGLLAREPYFVTAAVLLLRHGGDALDDARRKELSQAVALCSSDRRTVAFAKYGDDWARFYPEAKAPGKQDTNDVIDIFLRTYGNCSPEEERQLERMIFNPTPDYAELLARQEQTELPAADEAPEGSHEALINAFIRENHPGAQPVVADTPPPVPSDTPVSRPETHDDSLLSESLAKIFIRKGRYERAFEIISGLSLKFPKKSAYFADQLRFLQKLIINQRRLQQLAADAPIKK